MGEDKLLMSSRRNLPGKSPEVMLDWHHVLGMQQTELQ